MTVADLFSFIYVLMAEQAGGQAALEEQIQKWHEEEEKTAFAQAPNRMAPDKQLPEPLAQGMRSLMEMAPPAPRKDAN